MSPTWKARWLLPAPRPVPASQEEGDPPPRRSEGLPGSSPQDRLRAGRFGGAEFPAGSEAQGTPEDGQGGAERQGYRVGPSALPLSLSASPSVNSAYFTAHCSRGNWNEDELQAAGRVPAVEGLLPAQSGKGGVTGTAVGPALPTHVSVPGASSLSRV